MSFQIKEVILWPKKEGFSPARHLFETGAVNIITGSSKTGKSAIIPIIDYCLGSSSCSIPTGIIRKNCSWFGVLIQLSGRQLLLIRKEPELSGQSERMIMLEGKKLEIPQKIDDSLNVTNKTIVKKYLNELAGIPEFALNTESQESYNERPSFRDLLAFNFQPQNIIANPTSVFFRTDISNYRERLKQVFPYALGAETSEILEARWRLSSLRKILRFKKKELEDQIEVAKRWQEEAELWVGRAFEYGLVSAAEYNGASLWDERIKLLKMVAIKKPDSSSIEKVAIDNLSEKARELEKEETNIRYHLGILTRRESELKSLHEEYRPYLDSLILKKDRVAISSWLEALASDHSSNDLLEGESKFSLKTLKSLSLSVNALENEIEEFKPNYQLITKELAKVNEEVSLALFRLRDVQRNRLSIQRVSGEEDRQRYNNEKIAHFLGSLEQAIKVYESQKVDSELALEVRKLELDVAELEEFTSVRKIKKIVDEALISAQEYGHKLLQGLDVENPERNFEIDIDNLNIKVIESERKDFLWQMGSGANWLGYHLAVIFGLQKHFLSLANNPVPSFVILDQPSQVYFPAKQRIGKNKEESSDQIIGAEDINAVKNIYRTLSKVVNDNKSKIQIIVLDHADDDIWGELTNIHVAGRWRGDKKLVPIEWVNAPSSNVFD